MILCFIFHSAILSAYLLVIMVPTTTIPKEIPSVDSKCPLSQFHLIITIQFLQDRICYSGGPARFLTFQVLFCIMVLLAVALPSRAALRRIGCALFLNLTTSYHFNRFLFILIIPYTNKPPPTIPPKIKIRV